MSEANSGQGTWFKTHCAGRARLRAEAEGHTHERLFYFLKFLNESATWRALRSRLSKAYRRTIFGMYLLTTWATISPAGQGIDQHVRRTSVAYLHSVSGHRSTS